MSLNSFRVLILSLVSLGTSEVGAQHAHGIARLGISVEEKGFLLQLDSPLDSLVGFERAPRNNKEVDAVRTMAAALRDPGKLVSANAKAGCTPAQVRLSSGALPGELLGNPGQAAPKTAGEHADLQGTFDFRCTAPQSLRVLDFSGWFTRFRRLERVDVQLVTGEGQAKHTLTRARREIKL